MEFSSLVFLFVFLPIVLLGNFLLPQRLRNGFLLIANLFFYAYGEPVYVLLMIASILVNYTAGRLISSSGTKRGKKAVLVVAILLNLGALGFFKYTTMVLQTLSPFLSLPAVQIALPIGISFYTFQALSYVIDVYWEKYEADRSLIGFAAYISLFPQLIAGPIVRYDEVRAQLAKRNDDLDKINHGIVLFVIGLCKKILLANALGQLWQAVAADVAAAGTACAWLGIAAYTLQLYLDFSGYSDMARGLGAMLGFDFCINFDYPYLSTSITEFWRRWHISLSSWFRDYVYIPLGGSKEGALRQCVNLLIVWALTGLWHGAGWNFVLWGLYYGVLLILEKFVLKKVIVRLPKAIGWLYTIVLVMVGWVLFASNTIGDALGYIGVLFSITAQTGGPWLPSWLPLIAAGCLAATPLAAMLWKRVQARRFAVYVQTALCLLGLVLCTAGLAAGGYNPFLYFRF